MVRAALKQGWRMRRRGAHLKLYSPDGKTIVSVPVTASDHRSYQNTLAHLRRGGLRFP